jgi:hypothetical protein
MENFLSDRDVFSLLTAIRANNDKIKALVDDNDWKIESIRINLQRLPMVRDGVVQGSKGEITSGRR